MQIRFIEDNGPHQTGQIVTLPAIEAKKLIEAKVAVLAGPPVRRDIAKTIIRKAAD